MIASALKAEIWLTRAQHLLPAALYRSEATGRSSATRARKLRKLVRSPRAFFLDALDNRKGNSQGFVEQLQPHALSCPGYVAKHRYSVIVPAYNVAKYLEPFFTSIVRQTVDFESTMELIIVDDGSTDESAAIIGRFGRRFPGAVKCLRQENAGQAAARNRGLECATGDWITFIDPDDFVAPDYFQSVDEFLVRNASMGVELLCCNWIFFKERGSRVENSHPLRERFEGGDRVVDYGADSDALVSSAARSFFRGETLRLAKLRFNESLRPNFEDGDFTGQYLVLTGACKLGYVARAMYYYRKRADGSSTLDQGWENPRRFAEVVELGYLALLQKAARDGQAAPLPLQRLVLYDVYWLFRRIVDQESAIAFLSASERARFSALLDEVFQYISPRAIDGLEFSGYSQFYRVGLLGLYKSEAPTTATLDIVRYDAPRRCVQLRYFYHRQLPQLRILVGGKETAPTHTKSKGHEFLGRPFVDEFLAWVPLGVSDSTLQVEVDGKLAQLTLQGQAFPSGVPQGTIAWQLAPSISRSQLAPSERQLRDQARERDTMACYRSAWLLMDRDRQADDNAEHLYHYIREHYPEINAFFVLGDSSHDWKRLQRQGARLLAFGSRDHHLALLNASHLISSHADNYLLNQLPRGAFGDMLRYRFTFLQHGVIRDDISGWLDAKPIDLFVTSSPREHASIAGDGSRYRFTSREAKMVGLSRHDALLTRPESTERIVLIMPTWRDYLVGASIPGTSKRTRSPAFSESAYARRWSSLLRSPHLEKLARRHDYRVVFFPHANMQHYVGAFNAPAWVEVRTHAQEPVLQRLYRRAAVMITDYSSVFFEMALLDKPIIYYQFDREEMYGGGHPSRLGYFDFERDGFGPVSTHEAGVLGELEALLQRNCAAAPEYLERMRSALPLRDGLNRERTVQAILALESA